MKKITLSIFTILFTISLIFNLAGCNDNGNAEQPPRDGQYYNIAFNNDGRSDYNWRYSSSDYESYFNYLNDEYYKVCSDTFYIWTPGESGLNGNPYNGEGFWYSFRFKSFNIYAYKNKLTNKYKNTKLIQNITVYSREWNNEDLSNDNPVSVDMRIITAAVSNVEGELEIRFGEYGQLGENVYGNYANVFCGETCVATVTYSWWDYDGITQAWIENYIKNHLILWGC